jgi:hypothetical protein
MERAERADSIIPSVGRPGAPTSIRIHNVRVGARWELLEAEDLRPSFSVSDNQFRDRTRVASHVQISHIAAAPAFDLLSDAPIMDYGAPTLSENGVAIIGGNGRAAGLVQAYRTGAADEYRRELDEQAPRFGLSTAGMREPILVRRFTEPVDIRLASLASNEGGGLRLSLLEQARVDAERIGTLADFYVDENGAPNLAASRTFMQRFLSRIPDTEQAALVDVAGCLSQEGLLRVRNAVLCRAYGDSPTLGRLVESVDPGLRNLATALIRVAPKIADTRERIGRGDLYPLDIVDQLLEAVEQINILRAQAVPIDAFLDQLGLFGDGVSVEIAAILRQLDASARSAKGIAEFLSAYYDQVVALGSPKQESIFGKIEAPTRAEILHVSAKPVGSSPSKERPPTTTGARSDESAGAPGQRAPDKPPCPQRSAQSDQPRLERPFVDVTSPLGVLDHLDEATISRLEQLRRVMRASARCSGQEALAGFWQNAEARFGAQGAAALAEMMDLLGVDVEESPTAGPSPR